jgi:hypothetical protein
METMMPHIEQLARAFDELDEVNYVDFDTSEVPILQLYRQERERYLLTEFQTGLISSNEYRMGSGRKETESDLADSLLLNPNLIPIANTKKKMPEKPSVEMGGQPGAPPMPGEPPVPGAPPMPGEPPVPGMPPAEPLDPNTMAGAIAATQAAATSDVAQSTIPPEAMGAPSTTEAPLPPGAASESTGSMMYKSAEENDTELAINRWEEILNRSIERVIERQQRVVLEKSSGIKAKKSLFNGSLEIESILSPETWDKQMDEDIRPVVSAIIQDSFSVHNEKYTEKGLNTKSSFFVQGDIAAQVESQMQRIKELNQEAKSAINAIMFNSLSVVGEEGRSAAFRQAVVGYYANLLAKHRFEIAEDETRRAWRFGQQ